MQIYAKGALGLSTGPTKETAKGITAEGEVTSSALPSTFIVPDIGIKLGATCAYPIAHRNMMVDVGWLWMNYFEPLITRVGGIVHAENFGFQGPYAGLSYKW